MINSKIQWVPQPETWEELKYSLHCEDKVIDYNPQEVEDRSDLLNLF